MTTLQQCNFLPSGDRLWQNIQELTLAEIDAELPFEAKLAYQCHWTMEFSRRVIGEYRRFLYLTQVATSPIAPPGAVDQAWHLHLLQTHFYWDVMCHGLFGKKLHHTPTRSGAGGRAADATRYDNALRAYREAFGTEPPPDIWPVADKPELSISKTRPASSNQQIGRSSVPVHRFLALAMVILAGLATWLSKPQIRQVLADVDPVYQVLLFGTALVTSFLALNLWARKEARPKNIDAFEAALLHRGENHMLNTALIRLVDLDLVTFVTNGRTGDNGTALCRLASEAATPPIALDPIESVVLALLTSTPCGLDELSRKARSSVTRSRTRLQAAGLWGQAEFVSVERLLCGLIAVTFTTLSAIMLDVPGSLSYWKFIVFGLATWPLVVLAVILWPMFTGTPGVTRDGKASLKLEQGRNAMGRDSSFSARSRASLPTNLAMQFALFGSKAVIQDKRFYGINYLTGSIAATAHSDDTAGCGDNLPKCG